MWTRCWRKASWSWWTIQVRVSSRRFLLQKSTGGWCLWSTFWVWASLSSLPSSRWRQCHQFWVDQEEGLRVLGCPYGRMLPDPDTPGHLALSMDCSGKQDLSVQSSVFQPFDSSPVLHQDVCLGLWVDSQERYQPPLLSGHLVGDCGVSSSPPSSLRTTPPAVSGRDDCYLLGEVRPPAGPDILECWRMSSERGSSQQTLGLSVSGIVWAVSFSAREGVAVVGSRGTPGAVCSQGSHPVSPSSVAAEGPLVSSCRQSSSASFSVLGILKSAFVGGFRRRDGHQETLSKCPLLLSFLYIDASVTGWGAYLLDLTAAGMWSLEERAYKSCQRWRPISWP